MEYECLSCAGVGRCFCEVCKKEKRSNIMLTWLLKLINAPNVLKSIRNNFTRTKLTMGDDTELYICQVEDIICILPDPYKNGATKRSQQKIFLWIHRLISQNQDKDYWWEIRTFIWQVYSIYMTFMTFIWHDIWHLWYMTFIWHQSKQNISTWRYLITSYIWN